MAGGSRAATVPVMASHFIQTMRELHSRMNDGIRVRLLWSEDDGRVAVTVADAKTGEEFAIEVRQGDRPLDVFHHPYAYAAWRGVETRALQAA
jgi:hypothetical protein